jgi:hypothetical protein
MTTLTRSIDALQKTEEVLQELAEELTIEWFTGPDSPKRNLTGMRMLRVGALLYDTPRDFLHICLWELIVIMHPETARNPARRRALFRPDTWPIADAIHEGTTWDEFESALIGELPPEGHKPKGTPVVPIH